MADHDDTKAPGMMARIDDDDVEGHMMQSRVDADEDVEGHVMRTRVDDAGDDVEGHVVRTRVDAEDDDVEGHFGQLKSPSSRGE